uniref:Splicing factor, CC1-like protein n=1 Tax=Angiostrongylus cantonensis TaxID=6313 RepID=A0A0K0DDV0_ANGCA
MMADDTGFDVDDMLENALESKSTEIVNDSKEVITDKENGSSKKKKEKNRSRSRSRLITSIYCFTHPVSRSRSRERRRSSRDRRRDRRSRSRPRVIDHRDRRSPIRRSPPPRSRLPGPERRDVMPFTARSSPPRGAKLDMSAEERDQRTLFILQIARQTRPRDLEEFFSAVGSVRDVRIITDSRTGRSKGIAYVEFWEEESVPLGLALSGQKLLGAPLVIQRTCAERNRAANATIGTTLGFGPAPSKGPCKLHVSHLHPNITESMLDGIFDAFGRVEKIEVVKDPAGNSLGYAFVTFKLTEDGTKAMEQLNGFEIAGKPIKVSVIDEDEESIRQRSLDDVADEKQGLALGQGGRIQLMAKLAQGTGIELPQAAQQALQQQAADPTIPAIATQCFMLSNMFDPKTETRPMWAAEVRDDVIEECYKNGGALHVYVDTASPQGNVYVKCPSIANAHKSVSALHGRWFSGKVITANYVPVSSYHELFPDAVVARNILVPKPQDQVILPPQVNTAPVTNFAVPPPPTVSGYSGPPPQAGFY